MDQRPWSWAPTSGRICGSDIDMKRTQITLQEIAEEGHVSRATVSLALRNHPSIPSETRGRIQAVANRLGYRPNPLISTLMSYQRRAKGGAERGISLGL